jgi:hypothetical protein
LGHLTRIVLSSAVEQCLKPVDLPGKGIKEGAPSRMIE